MSTNPPKPGDSHTPLWDRFRGEPLPAYHAFSAYREMGPHERTLRKVQKALDGQGRPHPLSTLRRWYDFYAWQDRAKAFDDHLAARRAERWEQRRGTAYERAFRLSQKLHERIDQMLDHPLTVKATRTRNVQGQVVAITKVYPAKWTYGNIAALAQAAVQLETGSILASLAAHDGFDPRTATVEECRAYLIGRGILPDDLALAPPDPDVEPGPIPDDPDTADE